MERLDISREFSTIAGSNGVLGNPKGFVAYGYARVSSSGQAEEGSSGLPRQLQAIHQTAIRDNLCVPFELLFVDDGYSGFEFEDRPAFTKLRHELRTHKRAEHLLVEEIDRLSRNADWHQGFLLDEFARRKVTVHFFHQPNSELERYIKGYIAQEAMRKEKERMRLGKVYKAMDGRVTATRAAYGYQLSDPKNTHYVIDEEEAVVVRMVYDSLTKEGKTLWEIADDLNALHIPGRLGGKWSPGTLLNMVKNEVYKGWFITNRNTYELTGYDEDGKKKRKWRKRPEEEWIWVSVPLLVNEEQWQDAQAALKSNRKYATRNAGTMSNWLLSGLVECEICHYQYQAARGGTSVKGMPGTIRYYHCGGRWSHKARALGTACSSPYVHATALEDTVWRKIEELILTPEQVIPFIKETHNQVHSAEMENKMGFLGKQIARLKTERNRWDAAYARELLELDDYETKVKDIQAKLRSLTETQKQIEADYKKLILERNLEAEVKERLEGLRSGLYPDLPHDLKRNILTILIDKIVFNSEAQKGTVYGAIPPTLFEIHSARVIQHKKGDQTVSIPFELPFDYTPLPIDSVPAGMQVRPQGHASQRDVHTVEEAIASYLDAFEKQFSGRDSLRIKTNCLNRFAIYLKEKGHSMKLADLALADGQAFLDSITHAYLGTEMSPQTKKRYRSALRSFGRFLFNGSLRDDDVFFLIGHYPVTQNDAS